MARRIECSPAAVALAKALLEDGNIKSRADVNVVSPINSISRRTVQSLSLARSAIFFASPPKACVAPTNAVLCNQITLLGERHASNLSTPGLVF